jgi:hypothetical protein
MRPGPAGDPRVVMRYVDRLLACDGDLADAHAAAKQIFLARPNPDPHRRLEPDEVDSFLQQPWHWLRALSEEAEDRGDHVIVAKLALMCFLWNRLLIPLDSRIQIGALVKAPRDAEAGLYAPGLRAMDALPPGTVLGGGQGGEFLVEDSRGRVATGLVVLHSEGAPVDPDAYRRARELVD